MRILKGPFSFYLAHECQEVILDQLLHVQYPLDKITSDLCALGIDSKRDISVTVKIFVTNAYMLLMLSFVTGVEDLPVKLLVISAPDGLLKYRTIQCNHFFRANRFHVYSTTFT